MLINCLGILHNKINISSFRTRENSSELFKTNKAINVNMKISQIEIKNFRAFKGDAPFTLSLNKGDNLLVYGENGSGKTSLFSALKNFFESSVKKYDIDKFPFRSIFVQTGDCYVKLDFFDKAAKKKTPNPQARAYEWSNN